MAVATLNDSRIILCQNREETADFRCESAGFIKRNWMSGWGDYRAKIIRRNFVMICIFGRARNEFLSVIVGPI